MSDSFKWLIFTSPQLGGGTHGSNYFNQIHGNWLIFNLYYFVRNGDWNLLVNVEQNYEMWYSRQICSAVVSICWLCDCLCVNEAAWEPTKSNQKNLFHLSNKASTTKTLDCLIQLGLNWIKWFNSKWLNEISMPFGRCISFDRDVLFSMTAGRRGQRLKEEKKLLFSSDPRHLVAPIAFHGATSLDTFLTAWNDLNKSRYHISKSSQCFLLFFQQSSFFRC